MPNNIIKYLALFIPLIAFQSTAQEVLFIGLYSKKDASKSYWCSDMAMEKQVVASEAEAIQLKKDFLLTHAKESPIVKIAHSGTIVLYQYQKPVAGFNCKVNVISWKEDYSNSKVDIRQLFESEKAKIQKEYKSDIKEIFQWSSNKSNVEELNFTIDGIQITLKTTKKTNHQGKTLAFFKNPLTDKAAEFIMVLDGVPEKKSHKITPGGSTNIDLGNAKKIGIKLVLIPTKSEEGLIDWAKQKIKEAAINTDGKLELQSVGLRG